MSKVLLHITTLIVSTCVCGVLSQDLCIDSTIFRPVHFKDNITSDEPIYIYPDVLSLRMKTCDDLFRFNESSVYVKDDLLQNCNAETINCDIVCKSPGSNEITQTVIFHREKTPFGSMFFSATKYIKQIQENEGPKEFMNIENEIKQTDCFGKGTTNYELKIIGDDQGPFGISGYSIRTMESLDYEQRREYNITLEYTQMNTRTNRTTIVVEVEDVDDMDPVFNHTIFTYNITENTKDTDWNVTAPVISAHDRDLGQGRQNLTFSFLDDTSELDGKFMLNDTDGRIKVTKELDREEQDQHVLIIKVKQENNRQRSATATLQVNVLDQNDNVPTFDTLSLETSIDEHSSEGTIVKIVSANDKDKFPYNQVIYELSNYTDQLCVTCSNSAPGTIRVHSRSLLDREILGDTLVLKVIAFDKEDGSEGGNLTLTIKLNDINDNTPQFDKPRYDFLGNTIGVIGQINATDIDDPQNGNGKVRYYLPDPFMNDIIINSSTGEVNLTSPVEEDLEVLVEACDNPAQQSARRCNQTHLFVRANTSDAIEETQTATVFENARLGTVVTVVKKKGTYYEINEQDVPFKLDARRGAVTVEDLIDRENGSEVFVMNIRVKSNTHRLIANVTLNITVLDDNDNWPIFDKSEYFFELPDQLSTGTVIGSVNASDKDIGNNSLLYYYIPASLISPYFAIDGSSGEIIISNHNFPDGREFFQFPVTAKDNGEPSLQSSCYVYISRTIVKGTLVQIGTPFTVSELQSKQSSIQSELNKILKPLLVRISKTEGGTQSAVETKSFMFIQATNGTGAPVPADQLQRAVLQHMDSINALFRQHTPLQEPTSDDFGASQIALIVLAAVILFGGIAFIYMIYKSRSTKPKDDNNTSLVTVDEEKETDVPKGPEQDHVSMHSIEVTVDLGDEQTNQSDQTSDYDGSQNAISESNAVGCINPAYEVESNEVVLAQDGMQENATSKEVEHELDRLSDMLEKEERKSFTENASNASGVEDEEGVVQKLYPSLHTYENEAGLNDNHDSAYENTFWCGQSGDNGHANEFETSNDENQDRESGEFIAESKKPYDQSTMKDGISSRSYENIVDVLDEEPDIDYNDKQVRFAAVVLDSEENKFEPLKDKGDENTTEAEENEDDQTHEDNRENDSGLEYQQDENSTLPEVNETPFEDVALEEEVTAF